MTGEKVIGFYLLLILMRFICVVDDKVELAFGRIRVKKLTDAFKLFGNMAITLFVNLRKRRGDNIMH